MNEVQQNVGVVSQASATFEGLYEKVEETSSRVKQMLELVNKVEVVSVQMKKISQSQVHATDQIVQSVDGMNQQTKNVAENSTTVAEEVGKLENESKKLMNYIGSFQVE